MAPQAAPTTSYTSISQSTWPLSNPLSSISIPSLTNREWNEQYQANISSTWAQATQTNTNNSNAVLHSTATHTEHTMAPQQLQNSVNVASTSPNNKGKEMVQLIQHNTYDSQINNNSFIPQLPHYK
ncbi:24156_t:CDS:2 [Gigaspora margarita]|uniref:24156_t:CDS:1 n=1 Tax=Gigaspora margarita TaxID=4874 RepID=A0ABN7U7V6_GIGMA|nr:24156_t:CDS:2 [Gigaspora margarita]